MDCKFLDSYQADLDGDAIDVWYCRKRDPFVLGPTREVALRTCSGCRLSDNTRPPSELANEVERRNQELVALNAIVSAVNSSLDLSTVLNTGLDKAIEILQVDAGWIVLASDESLQLALHRGVSADYAGSISTIGAQEGVVGLVAREQQTVVVDDVAANDTLPLAAAEGLATILATPLKAQGSLLGVMAVATRETRSYSADDVYFASSAGAQLASAIEHALLFREQIDRVERERRLLQAVETVNRSLGTHAVSTTVVAEAARLMNASKAALLVLKDGTLVAEDVHNLSAEFCRVFVLPLDESASGPRHPRRRAGRRRRRRARAAVRRRHRGRRRLPRLSYGAAAVVQGHLRRAVGVLRTPAALLRRRQDDPRHLRQPGHGGPREPAPHARKRRAGAHRRPHRRLQPQLPRALARPGHAQRAPQRRPRQPAVHRRRRP